MSFRKRGYFRNVRKGKVLGGKVNKEIEELINFLMWLILENCIVKFKIDMRVI